MDKVLDKIIIDIAKQYDIDRKEVELILNSPYKFMRDIITSLELKGKLYPETVDMKKNFNMPVLFKLYVNEYKLNKLNTKEDEEIANAITNDSSDIV